MAKDTKHQIVTDNAVNSPEVEELFAGGESVNLGFAPYWNPLEGARLAFVPLALDDRDPAFPRIICRALHSLRCQRGPKVNAEKVTVEAGEAFTMSPYPTLHLESLFGIPVRVTFGKQVPITPGPDGKPRKMWTITELTVPQGKKADVERLHSERIAALSQLKRTAQLPSTTNNSAAHA
jgi:hypothetical protein